MRKRRKTRKRKRRSLSWWGWRTGKWEKDVMEVQMEKLRQWKSGRTDKMVRGKKAD